MSIYVWTSKIKNVYVWTTPVKEVYVWTTKVRPSWYTPWSNTIAYYPLTSTTTVNDMSGNNRNLTNNGTQFWTYWWVSCAYFPQGNSKKLYWTLPLTWNQIFTINVYIWRIWNSYNAANTWSQIFVLWNTGSSWWCFWTAIKDSTSSTPNRYINYTRWSDKLSSYTNTTWHRELITVTNDTSTIKMYRDGTLINDNSISFSVNSTNFTIGSFPTSANDNRYQNFYWYMSEFIVESKTWTATEILDYFNTTKSKYWL